MQGSNRPTIKVAHISDVHIDPYYLVGSNVACGNFLCCRKESGSPSNSNDAAMQWGSAFNCDMPINAA
jgi:sphingomyelin phosphodiesterase